MSQQVTPAPRSLLRRVLPLLVTVWLVLEIWLLTVVADQVGWLTVVLLLIAGAVLGGALIRRAGERALSAAFAQTREPAEQPQTNTSFKVLGGVLLMVPGFLSDVLGLSMLFPPTRALWRALGRRVGRHALRKASPAGGDAFADAMRLHEQLRIHRPGGKVIPGEVVDPGRPQDGPDTTHRPPVNP